MMTGNNSIELEFLDSTQDYLKALLKEQQLPEGTLVHTPDQQKGRGFNGTSWESSKGSNLTFSFLWRPQFLHPREQFRLNKALALAVYDFAAGKLEGERVKIKWPNDIYIDDKKAAGILIENDIMHDSIRHSVIGIGINLNQQAFHSDAPNPVSLKTITGRHYDIYDCLDEMCLLLDKRYEQLRNGDPLVDEEYFKNLYRLGTSAPFEYKGTTITASITGISGYGHLIIKTDDDRELHCDLKEIRFL